MALFLKFVKYSRRVREGKQASHEGQQKRSSRKCCPEQMFFLRHTQCIRMHINMSDNLQSNPTMRVKAYYSIHIAKEPAQHGKPLLYAGTCSAVHFAFPGTSVRLPFGYHCRRNTFKSSLLPKQPSQLYRHGESKKIVTPQLGLRILHTLPQGVVNVSIMNYSMGSLNNMLLLPTAQPQTHRSPEVAEFRSFRKFSKNVSLFPLLSTFHSQEGDTYTCAQIYINAYACMCETVQRDIQNSEVQLILTAHIDWT